MSDMKNRKVSAARHRARQRKQRNRRIAMTLCLMIVVCVASIGGTLAWLTSTTTPVINTFTPSTINIELDETTGGSDRQFKMVPGDTIDKDPKVTVVKGSEKCWLFVKVDEVGDLSNYIDYTVDTSRDAWTELTDVEGVNNVYWRLVEGSAVDQPFSILTDDQVTVKQDVTKDMMDALKANPNLRPKLTFTAFAVQHEGSNDEKEAWDKLFPSSPTTP